jgi:hypothetical protein
MSTNQPINPRGVRMRKQLTIASAVSLSVLPMLMPAKDASAVPAFARKYGTSCYTCHSGFPQRNAFGEAFKNNGYRWPGGEDEEKSKQEQLKMGADGWKKTFPQSPWPTDIPGFAPFAIYITGPLVNYSDKVDNNTPSKRTAQTLNWNGPVDARILYGGTVGSNIGIVGAFEKFSSGSTTTNLRVTYVFSPGVNLAVGNGFSAFSGTAAPTAPYTGLYTASGTGVEVNYIAGKDGRLQFIGGVASAGTQSALSSTQIKVTGAGDTDSVTNGAANTNANKLADVSYARMKYKFGGAGLLSGAGGTYGNEFVGLDNSFAVGVNVVGNRAALSAETLTYGADISGNYGNFTAGAAWSRGRDLGLNNYAIDAGYYIYPWLMARVKYANIGALGDQNKPTWTPSLTAWIRANASLAVSYKYNTKNVDPTKTDGTTLPNTVTLTAGVAF